jgi:dolichyl-phosphate beta-glucosyltransferase
MIDLSIIIPIHNEQRRLPICLAMLNQFISRSPLNIEVILSENGSTDDTLPMALAASQAWQGYQCITTAARSKGAAVCQGMLAARGSWVMMADVDWSMPVDRIYELWEMRHTADIIIASREAPGAMRVGEPWRRHIMGRAFNLMTRLIVPGINDTQCGFKLFTAAAAAACFIRQEVTGLGFDVEILFIARRLGLTIYELGIPWVYDPDSRVRTIRDAARMAADLWRIYRNGQAGVYDNPLLDIFYPAPL